MKNQGFAGTPTGARFAVCPSAITAGMPVLIGTIPAVALDDYQANQGGTTFYTNGSFNLTVIGQSVVSPLTTAAVNPGDKIYAVGTLDAPTNVTYNLTLDKASGGALFGKLDPTATVITAGTTDTNALVALNVGAA